MTLAAARIGASRSAVSQQITNLENTLGAGLVDRTARPLTLTPVGHILRRHAHRVLEALSDARTELMEVSLSALAELRLEIIDDPGRGIGFRQRNFRSLTAGLTIWRSNWRTEPPTSLCRVSCRMQKCGMKIFRFFVNRL